MSVDADKVRGNNKYRRGSTKRLVVSANETPDSVKVEMDRYKRGGRHQISGEKYNKRYRKGTRKTTIKVEEPLGKIVDAIMWAEGVSDARLAMMAGINEKTVTALRTKDGVWKRLLQVRKLLWIMGYELELRARRTMSPAVGALLTGKEAGMRMTSRKKVKIEEVKDENNKVVKRKAVVVRESWQRLKMWDVLEKMSE